MTGNEIIDGESPFQIIEGNCYDYEIPSEYTLRDTHGIVISNKINNSYGTIAPNIYVGTLSLDIYRKAEKFGEIKLEVRSVKTDYRTDYRKMLSNITEQCLDLIFLHSSPVTQTAETDYDKDFKTWHQRFAFVKSIIDTDEFSESVNKIISSPSTKWKENEIEKDIRSIGRLRNKEIRQIAGARNRINLPDNHPLKSNHLQSVPSKIIISGKIETVDTTENQFVKYALQSFLVFVTDFLTRLRSESKTKLEAEKVESQLEQILGHSVFKEISNPSTILLNSPILQRKEGYREILKIWLMFGLAAKLTWKGGEDVYDIEKRNIAVLYEYWLFFELLKIVDEVFGLKPDKSLIVDTNDNLNLQLKQGEHFAVRGKCDKYSRKLNVCFSYNRTFSGSATDGNYPAGGSWTKSMKPDYTLSIWPQNITENEAEEQELIVHIHFDAKYKIEEILQYLGEVTDLVEEKIEQSKGTYKRADLLKMHAYKDAIRRTGGAYILYPGKEKNTYKRRGFRELIPGLGAFQVRPSENNDTGSEELVRFFHEVVEHFIDRVSQREKAAYRIFEIHKDEPMKDSQLKETFAEASGSNRGFLPDETFVLVGFCKSDEHFKWIEDTGLYNLRPGPEKDPIFLNSEITGAKYLLLHSEKEAVTDMLYKIKDKGPRIYSKKDLINLLYPNPGHEYYLVYELDNEAIPEFKNKEWDIRKFKNYKSGRQSAQPFTATYSELFRTFKK
ncbi:MAG TPA: DUF2357 domain-containing protein [Ignavibacteria bacterium]|nr:DUF2357 domain-containing protein [Ignavibacteria bacterium]